MHIKELSFLRECVKRNKDQLNSEQTVPFVVLTVTVTVTVTVNFIFTLREPNVYKPHGFFLGFLATFICFCVTVSFYRSLYFVVNQIKLQVTWQREVPICSTWEHEVIIYLGERNNWFLFVVLGNTKFLFT